MLVAAREADPDEFRRSETHLVEAARNHSVDDLQRVAAYWRQAVEKGRALDGDKKIRQRRRLHASVTFMGMERVDGGRPVFRRPDGSMLEDRAPP